jgi:hypothetical protein
MPIKSPEQQKELIIQNLPNNMPQAVGLYNELVATVGRSETIMETGKNPKTSPQELQQIKEILQFIEKNYPNLVNASNANSAAIDANKGND